MLSKVNYNFGGYVLSSLCSVSALCCEVGEKRLIGF